MAICTTGKWVDKKTGRVVDSPPQEGRLLVAPGAELTPSLQDQVRRAEERSPQAPPAETASTDDDEKADEASEPETAALSDAPEASAATGRTGKPRPR